ncbi:MAG: acyl carrier protein [Deltaproteobacteria bacterium]|nr:acyl carrier protein [Deltaproteobacteria bacterium]MBK05264.1 acyl carrier protein [Deltaproteobacteria bacterium]
MTNQEKLVQSFVESLGIKPEQVVDDLKYQSIEEWDSVGHMALVAELEANFDIMLDTDDIIDMSSVAIAKTILQKYEVSFA